MPSDELCIDLRNASKTFGDIQVLKAVDLQVAPNEVHALIGENGCGKSTLIKCLSGYQPFDPGATLSVRGKDVSLPLTSAAVAALGVRFIHQDLGLVPTLTVMENVAFGEGFLTRRGRISWRREAERTADLLSIFGNQGIKPTDLVGELSQARQTIVAIARGLGAASSQTSAMVLDEPTAALPVNEVHVLSQVIRRMKAEGVGIVFVSHRLEEIFDLADRVTVLRDGASVGTFAVQDLSERQLTELIIGRKANQHRSEPPNRQKRAPLLKADGLSGQRVRDVSFSVDAGEIVGVAGLVGSGRSELARLVFGAQTITAGKLTLGGKPLSLRGPGDGLEAGLALVPEDRRRDGAVPTMTVGENLTLPTIEKYFRRGWLRKNRERAVVESDMARFRINPPIAKRKFATLSGGNQQKVVLAKWFETSPRLLILDEPVQGVDIGARNDIYESLDSAAKAGMGVLMINSDFIDLARICHRVLIMRRGSLVGELEGAALTAHTISEMVYSVDGRA